VGHCVDITGQGRLPWSGPGKPWAPAREFGGLVLFGVLLRREGLSREGLLVNGLPLVLGPVRVAVMLLLSVQGRTIFRVCRRCGCFRTTTDRFPGAP